MIDALMYIAGIGASGCVLYFAARVVTAAYFRSKSDYERKIP